MNQISCSALHTMGSKVEYVETSQIYATNYVRNSKAIGVLWGIFTICFALICSVAFVTPEWIGISNKGRIGLWSSCEFDQNGLEECHGKFNEFIEISNAAFKISTILSMICVALAYITILVMLLFFFMQCTSVYMVCAWIQILASLCMILSLTIYPLGWDSAKVQFICGTQAARYQTGQCEVKWAYILAILGCCDIIVLAILAFILATRHIKLQPEPLYGEINNAYGDTNSVAGSRKSLNLHPVLLMPQGGAHGGHEQDRFSEFSNRTSNSKNSRYARPEYPASLNSLNNFQLWSCVSGSLNSFPFFKIWKTYGCIFSVFILSFIFWKVGIHDPANLLPYLEFGLNTMNICFLKFFFKFKWHLSFAIRDN